MRLHTERSFVDEFRWISPLHCLKNRWQTVFFFGECCKRGRHFYTTTAPSCLHSCIVLPPVGHSSNHEYHCCQLTIQWSCVSNFYRTFKISIFLSLVNVQPHFKFTNNWTLSACNILCSAMRRENCHTEHYHRQACGLLSLWTCRQAAVLRLQHSVHCTR